MIRDVTAENDKDNEEKHNCGESKESLCIPFMRI